MNEKILKMGKDEKEGNDRKRMINTIMNILNIVAPIHSVPSFISLMQ